MFPQLKSILRICRESEKLILKYLIIMHSSDIPPSCLRRTAMEDDTQAEMEKEGISIFGCVSHLIIL